MKNNQDNLQKLIVASAFVVFLSLNLTFGLPIAALITSSYLAGLMGIFLKFNWTIIRNGTPLTEYFQKLTLGLKKRFGKSV